MTILLLKNSMTYWWNSMTFQAWKIPYLNSMTFYEFPGCVGTL